MSAPLDGFLPRADVAKRLSVEVDAPVERVWEALRNTDFRRSKLVLRLIRLRGLAPGGRVPRPLDLASLADSHFVLLEESPGEHLVLGLVGCFWTPSGGLKRIDPESFLAGPPEGHASAAWSFELAAYGPEKTVLATETRVLAGDERSRRSFMRYWRLVGPFSSLIRREMLRLVRQEAERPTPSGTKHPDKESR